MKAIITFLILTVSSPALAGPILEQATRQATTIQLAQDPPPQPTGRRSGAAFWGGLTMLAVGTVALLATEQDCQGIRFGDQCLGETAWPKGPIAGSAVLMGSGFGLMLWGK